MDAEAVEDATLRAHRVSGDPVARVGGFLDGRQQSQVLGWLGACPVVYGEAGAAVRERRERRLIAWRAPRLSRHVYAPLGLVAEWDLSAAWSGDLLVDTLPDDADAGEAASHPMFLLERARLAVSRDREALERELGEAWCTSRDDPVLIDGGIGASPIVASSPTAVGVVKTHRTLYARAAELPALVALQRGERSSVVRIAPRDRHPVLSWYLRLHDATGRDVLWGLVRVEVSARAADPAARADEVSRWLLAERAPLAAPDERWHTMAYGIRNAEDLLRAVLSGI